MVGTRPVQARIRHYQPRLTRGRHRKISGANERAEMIKVCARYVKGDGYCDVFQLLGRAGGLWVGR
jgi:hypothetical protein